MSACTFFGHRNCPDTIKPKLRQALIDLIENHNVDMFYVGHQGRFDILVHSVLQDLKHQYTHIHYAVVLAYMPGKKTEYDDYTDTMLPEGIETVHPHYAISWRNTWMLKQADYVVCYITHTWGGAAQYVKKAKAQSKEIINIGDAT